jgi:hypothetical protein
MKSAAIDFLPKPFSDAGNDSGQPIHSDRMHNFYRNQAKTDTSISCLLALILETYYTTGLIHGYLPRPATTLKPIVAVR